MKQISAVILGVAASAVLAASVQAQSAAEKKACNDVRWKAEVLLQYPDIERSCVGVVERDGVTYVKVSGKVRSKDKDLVTVSLDKTNTDIKWRLGADDTVSVDGKSIPAKDVVVGQSLRFYMPADRVAVVDISDTGVKPRDVVP